MVLMYLIHFASLSYIDEHYVYVAPWSWVISHTFPDHFDPLLRVFPGYFSSLGISYFLGLGIFEITAPPILYIIFTFVAACQPPV